MMRKPSTNRTTRLQRLAKQMPSNGIGNNNTGDSSSSTAGPLGDKDRENDSEAGASPNGGRRASRGGRKWSSVRQEVVAEPELVRIGDIVHRIIAILKMPPEERSETHVKLLYQWLMSQEKLSSLITTMSEVSAKKLCKEMEFLHLLANNVVVHQGDKGNTCFILLSGLVSVYVRNPEEQKKHARMVRSMIDTSDGSQRQLMLQPVTLGTKVATLKPGATFGELCLIEPDSKRSATVIVDPAVESSNFIVLTAASYLRMTRSQTIEGTITDHIAFLQTMLLFRFWTKMRITELMHLINSMKLVTIPAKQYIGRKGTEADHFYIIIHGIAHETITLSLNDSNDPGASENRTVQRAITVELTHLGRFDVAGEFLASEKKMVLSPVDIRAVTDVDALAISRKLFQAHFAARDIKRHARRTLKMLRRIAETREKWRETRISQATQYPDLRVPITRKLMRLSGNVCLICGRYTHVAGDELCMELSSYNMEEETKKKEEREEKARSQSCHRISFAAPTQIKPVPEGLVRLPSVRETGRRSFFKSSRHHAHSHTPVDEDDEDEDEADAEDDEHGVLERGSRIGHLLVAKRWKQAVRAGLSSHRPKTTSALGSPSSPTTARPNKRTGRSIKRDIAAEIQQIRESWPYHWHEFDRVTSSSTTSQPPQTPGSASPPATASIRSQKKSSAAVTAAAKVAAALAGRNCFTAR